MSQIHLLHILGDLSTVSLLLRVSSTPSYICMARTLEGTNAFSQRPLRFSVKGYDDVTLKSRVLKVDKNVNMSLSI